MLAKIYEHGCSPTGAQRLQNIANTGIVLNIQQDRDQWNISSAQSLSCVWLFSTPWTTAHQASLSMTNSQSLLRLMSSELVMPSNHLILCHSLLLPPSVLPSIRVSLVISSIFLESFVHSSPVAYGAPAHLRSSSVKYKDEISMWRNKHSRGKGCSERLLSITESCLSYPSKQSYFFFPKVRSLYYM